MPFGYHIGRRMKDIPLNYWKEFLKDNPILARLNTEKRIVQNYAKRVLTQEYKRVNIYIFKGNKCIQHPKDKEIPEGWKRGRPKNKKTSISLKKFYNSDVGKSVREKQAKNFDRKKIWRKEAVREGMKKYWKNNPDWGKEKAQIGKKYAEEYKQRYQETGTTKPMKKHTKIYMDHFNLIHHNEFIDELVGCVAVDIHHINSRGMGGSLGKNDINNLMALSRKLHQVYGDKKIYIEFLKTAHKHFMEHGEPYLFFNPHHKAFDMLLKYPEFEIGIKSKRLTIKK